MNTSKTIILCLIFLVSTASLIFLLPRLSRWHNHSDNKPTPISYFRGFAQTPQAPTSMTNTPYYTLLFPHLSHTFYGLSLSKQGYILYPCGLDSSEDPEIGICLLDPTHPQQDIFERVIAAPASKDGGFFNPQGYGIWVVYAQDTEPLRILAKHLITGEQILIGEITSGQVEHPTGPFFAISQEQVIWVNEIIQPSGARKNIVFLFDLHQRKNKLLFELPDGHLIDHLAIEGPRLVYSKTQLDQTGTLSSDVYLYDIQHQVTTKLSRTGKASQVRIAFPFIAWKTDVHFSSQGSILLLDTTTGQEKEILSGTTFPNTYDWVTLSPQRATAIQNGGGGPVILYNIQSEQKETIDQSGGLTELSGHYIAWASRSGCTQATACLHWADLSKTVKRD